MCRTQICSIRDRKCLKHTPGKTLNNSTNEEHLEASGEEGNADSANHEYHAANHRLLVSDPFGDVSVDDESEDAADLSSVQDDGLPSRRNKFISVRVDLVAELVLEWREGEELVHQTRIVTFHDNAERDDKGENDRFPPKAQRLAHGHLSFVVQCLVRVVDDILARGRCDAFGHMAFVLVVNGRGHGERCSDSEGVVALVLTPVEDEDTDQNGGICELYNFVSKT
jgi:hypothetical protein